MTRLELLQLVVARARTNGFEFRRWYTGRLGLPWISAEASLTLLDTQRRYYALLFSHEFASTFWKPGTDITFEVPAQSFSRPMPDGSLRTIQRKSYIRRSLRPDVWRYHLREMSVAEEPLRYLRKYLHIEEQLDTEPELVTKMSAPEQDSTDELPGSAGKRGMASSPKAQLRPLPGGKPAFLQRPYSGSKS